MLNLFCTTLHRMQPPILFLCKCLFVLHLHGTTILFMQIDPPPVADQRIVHVPTPNITSKIILGKMHVYGELDTRKSSNVVETIQLPSLPPPSPIIFHSQKVMRQQDSNVVDGSNCNIITWLEKGALGKNIRWHPQKVVCVSARHPLWSIPIQAESNCAHPVASTVTERMSIVVYDVYDVSK